MKRPFLIRQGDIQPYHPANHTGTTNLRLIGAETVGAKHIEVLLGVIEKGAGAGKPEHPGAERREHACARWPRRRSCGLGKRHLTSGRPWATVPLVFQYRHHSRAETRFGERGADYRAGRLPRD